MKYRLLSLEQLSQAPKMPHNFNDLGAGVWAGLCKYKLMYGMDF